MPGSALLILDLLADAILVELWFQLNRRDAKFRYQKPADVLTAFAQNTVDLKARGSVG